MQRQTHDVPCLELTATTA